MKLAAIASFLGLILYVGLTTRLSAAAACMGPVKPGECSALEPTSGRRFVLYVPAAYDSRNSYPVVLDLHGRGGSPESQLNISEMRSLADQEGFVIVAPEGTGEGPQQQKKSWNAGVCCGIAYQTQVDDVSFIRKTLDLIATKIRIDLRRVYATGFSNGARMSHRLACELSDRIAAIAPISGVISNFDPGSANPMGDQGAFRCEPSHPVAVLEFHGLGDTCSPYQGGPGSLGDVNNNSAQFSAKSWALRNRCARDVAGPMLGAATRCQWSTGCALGSDVLLCTMADGGHVWPGGDPYQGWQKCGGSWPRDYSATATIWSFFKAHPKR